MPAHSNLTRTQTVAVETHGCKLNQADSSVVASEFARAGFRLVSTLEPADIYVVNSCTVTHVADRKARRAIRAARRRNPGATIVATGCFAQRAPAELEKLPEVDLVIGNTDKPTLVRRVSEWRGGPPVPCAVGDDVQPLAPRIARTRAAVKIQEGCDQVCAYCIVPRVRGRERSIPPEEILARIDDHVASGYREVVLTGTQLGTYGFDLDGITLEGLVRLVLERTGIERLRVSSLQPQEITPGLIRLWSDGRLCPHFHLPLQSGSDGVLQRMRRRYTRGLFGEVVDMIRDSVPGVAITTDVIAGFPGESERDFEDTSELCERVGFAAMHVFPYSSRPGTSAAHFGGTVSGKTKSERMERLLDLSRSGAADFRGGFKGEARPVLWEEAVKGEGGALWSGLTDNYIRVRARSRLALSNTITRARLGDFEKNVVSAEVLGPPS